MYQSFHERISVSVVFGKDGPRPVSFSWAGGEYRIRKITYTWKERLGESFMIHFAVTDGDSLFEISFNQRTLNWSLEKVYSEG